MRVVDPEGADVSECASVHALHGRSLAGGEVDDEATTADDGTEAVAPAALHHQPMQSMDLLRRYRSIFIAGPTFNLLPDDDTARQALLRMHAHLEPGGSALVPLFVPTATPKEQIGQTREARSSDGAILRVTAVAEQRDDPGRVQTTVLRYERSTPDMTDVLERPWVLHWYTQPEFRNLATAVGFTIAAVLGPDGRPRYRDGEGLRVQIDHLRLTHRRSRALGTATTRPSVDTLENVPVPAFGDTLAPSFRDARSGTVPAVFGLGVRERRRGQR